MTEATESEAWTGILVDADACPVREEVMTVALRYSLPCAFVSNHGTRLPPNPLFVNVAVGEGFDAADDWIAARSGPQSVVVTADILLADRCLAQKAQVVGPNGREFTPASIGAAKASRALNEDLRAMGILTGGPKPFSKRDRSAFLSALDLAVQRLRREGR